MGFFFEMKFLLKQAIIFDKNSPFHLQKKDILVENGMISQIEDHIEANDLPSIESRNLCVSVGWVDMNCVASDPGFEHREDWDSLTEVAQKGGFTDVALLPNTKPICQNKAAVSYIQQASLQHKVAFHAIAAITKDTEGKDFNEMLDLHHAGAVAFSDGTKTLWNADILLKSLLYVAPFNGLIINRPEDKDLALFGQMHEGIMSTKLGMKGIPSIAEEIMIQRDLKLLEYAAIQTNKPILHFSLISTEQGVRLIREAKKKGLPVSCDIASYQLVFTDEDLNTFDTNLKVSPPFRSKNDVKALQKGLADGTIDCLVSAHHPQEEENKKLEFDLAENGIINLQTAFSVALMYSLLGVEELIEKLTIGPRKLLNLPIPTIKVGEKARLTVFDSHAEWIFDEKNNVSKSQNSPFFGKKLRGKVIQTIVG